MLIALAIGAAAGVLAVLTGSGDVMGAVALTALWTVIACGSLLKSSPWIERPGYGAAFVLSIAQTVVAFVLATAYTWGEFFDLIDNPGEIFLGGSLLALLGTGWCATVGTILPARASESKLAGRIFVGTALLSFLCFEAAVIESAFDIGPDDDEMLASGAWILAAGVTLALATLHDRPRGRVLTLPATVCALLATTIVLAEIWTRLPDSRVGETVLAACICVPVVVAQIRLLYLWPMPERALGLRRWTIYAATGTATALVLVVATHAEFEGLLRVAGALAIVTAAGSLASTVVVVAERRRVARGHAAGAPMDDGRTVEGVSGRSGATAASVDALHEVQLECPRCGHAQSLALGGAPCVNCRLRIVVRLEA